MSAGQLVRVEGSKMKLFAALATCFALAGCAIAPSGPIDPGPKPTAAQTEAAIRAWMHDSLRDPDSVEDFKIDNYSQATANGWLTCFEYNAKNGFGAYVGIQRHGLVLRVAGTDVYYVPGLMYPPLPGC